MLLRGCVERVDEAKVNYRPDSYNRAVDVCSVARYAEVEAARGLILWCDVKESAE